MAAQSFVIKDYSIFVGQYGYPINHLHLFNDVGDYFVNIKFVDEPEYQNLTETQNNNSGISEIYAEFRSDFFSQAVDILRNEKPVSFQWDAAYKWAVLYTGKEPVGEEEKQKYLLKLNLP